MENSTAPTKGNLINAKKSLSLARVGYELMDKKRNILVREMMTLIDRANELQDKIDYAYSDAYKALQRANITLGFCKDLAQSVPEERGLSLNYRSVMGVELPQLSLKNDDKLHLHYGLNVSNIALDEVYSKFHQVKILTTNLAEIESSVYRLAIAIKKSQKRANALQNIIIPRLESQISNITEALEEKDREEFTRMKVIKKQNSNNKRSI